MKTISFCFIVLLTFFCAANSNATNSKPTHKFGNIQTGSFSHPEGVQKSLDYFYNDLLELDDDDIDDPDGENYSFRTTAFDTHYLTAHDFYNYRFKRTLYTGNSFSQGSPAFILLRVFRL